MLWVLIRTFSVEYPKHMLTLCILMDFSIQIKHLGCDCQLYIIMRHRSAFSNYVVFLSSRIVFTIILTNSLDPDEMSQLAAFHQGTHCLSNDPF